ncbi:hypothetical protein D3C79_894710 [compost metagenome]
MPIGGDMRHNRQHGRGGETIATFQLQHIGITRSLFADKTISAGQRWDVKALGAGGQQRPRATRHLAPRGMTLFAPDHIHMDLIADDLDPMAFA